MALSITPNFKPTDIARIVRDKMERIEKVIIRNLQFVGETFVANARNNANFTDRTGNLRGSISYVILKDGEEIADNFNSESLGANESARIIEELKPQFPKGYTLLVVAGMDYAAAVESKNYDVLTSSSLIAEHELKEAFAILKEQIGRME